MSAGDGRLTAHMKVDKIHCNTSNTLHGGLTATMIDALSTLALASLDVKGYQESKLPTTVSIEINMTYLRPAPINSEIMIECITEKRGKNIAFLAASIINKSDGKLVAKGNHLKAIINH